MRFSSVLSFGLFAIPFAAAGTIHDITVGSSSGALEFTPDAISAQPGDQVVFHFEQKNHTATQSSFADPCGKMDGGFDSGFMPVAANVTDNFPTYTITINDTTPVWVYCRQAANTPQSHCGQGMVFAVNCGADGSANSFTNFKNAALAIGQQLQAEAASSSAAVGYASSTMAVATSAAAASGTTASSAAAAPPAAASGTSTSSAAATTHTVVVGGNGTLTFSPSEIQAAQNDVVMFQFQSKNHTVTQSSFTDPCRELGATSSTPGFDSNFMPVAANSTDFPTFSITVNDTSAPIWGYCRQTGHCGMGMVFAINAVDNGPKNFTAFVSTAKALNGTSTASGAERTVTVASLGLGLVGVVFSLLL